MDDPKKIKRTRLILLALIVVIMGLFVYFAFFAEDKIIKTGEIFNQKEEEEKEENEEKFEKDKKEPASLIRSPVSYSWQNKVFTVDILDADLGSGLDPDSCQYKVFSYESAGNVHSSGWLSRKCNSAVNVSVGEKSRCRIEGEDACWIFARCQDKAGNWHVPQEELNSVAFYNIDWTSPLVSKVFIAEEQSYPILIEEGIEYSFKVNVKDNYKVVSCLLYINNEKQGAMSPLTTDCTEKCTFSKEFTPASTGIYEISVACRDVAKNWGWSEVAIAKTNIAPEISLCRVFPTKGSIQTEFQFEVEATDLEGDELSYIWNFGDGESSTEQNPKHKYAQAGTYEPDVKVFDRMGGEDSCSTAWVGIK